MKKIFSLTTVVLMIITFTSCFDSTTSGTTIEERISLLEEAINTHNYEAYMDCFDSSCNYIDTYIIGNFDGDYALDTVYSFGALSISGDTVTCTSSIDGTDGHTNTFTMNKSGDDYFILTWIEDGSTIFQKK